MYYIFRDKNFVLWFYLSDSMFLTDDYWFSTILIDDRLRRVKLQSLWFFHYTLNTPYQQAGLASAFSKTLSSKQLPSLMKPHLSDYVEPENLIWRHSCREDPYFAGLPISIIESWYQREGYVKSMADLIEKELSVFSNPEEVCTPLIYLLGFLKKSLLLVLVVVDL